MRPREGAEQAQQRWSLLKLVQGHYPEFIPFLEDVMEELGFSTSEIQKDIAGFIAYGPQNLMVQAQRGQLAAIMLKQGNPTRAILTTH